MTMNPQEKDTLVATVPANLFSSKFTFVGPEEVLTYEVNFPRGNQKHTNTQTHTHIHI